MSYLAKGSKQYTDIVDKVIDDFVDGKNKKEIANSNGIEIGFVISILQNNKRKILYKKNSINKDNIVNEDNIEVSYLGGDKMSSDESSNKIKEENPIIVESKKGKGKRVLDEAAINEIVELLTDDTIKYSEIGNMYGVGSSRIAAIAKKHGLSRYEKKEENKDDAYSNSARNTSDIFNSNSDKIDKEEKEQKESEVEDFNKTIVTPHIDLEYQKRTDYLHQTEPVDNILDNNIIDGKKYDITKIIKQENIYEVGLVDQRHDLPVSECIYFDITDDDMFNFKKLYNEACEYILSNISINSTIVLYCTGLQQALGSVIKACFDLRYNLVLKYYNAETKDYSSQSVITFPTNENKDFDFPFNFLINSGSKVYSYNCTLDDLMRIKEENEDAYCVFYSSKSLSNTDEKRYNIFCKDAKDTFDIFGQFSVNAQNIPKRNISVFIRKVKIFSSRVAFGDSISRTYNH